MFDKRARARLRIERKEKEASRSEKDDNNNNVEKTTKRELKSFSGSGKNCVSASLCALAHAGRIGEKKCQPPPAQPRSPVTTEGHES